MNVFVILKLMANVFQYVIMHYVAIVYQMFVLFVMICNVQIHINLVIMDIFKMVKIVLHVISNVNNANLLILVNHVLKLII